MSEWCTCQDRPRYVTGPLGMLDHPGGCDFPKGICEATAHRMTVHALCGRPIEMLFCGCTGSDHGYSHDEARDWWVHYACGWPTQAWFEVAGRQVPDHLRGVRPVTFHEFPVVPRNPKAAYSRLDEHAQKVNRDFAGRWVRD